MAIRWGLLHRQAVSRDLVFALSSARRVNPPCPHSTRQVMHEQHASMFGRLSRGSGSYVRPMFEEPFQEPSIAAPVISLSRAFPLHRRAQARQRLHQVLRLSPQTSINGNSARMFSGQETEAGCEQRALTGPENGPEVRPVLLRPPVTSPPRTC